MNKENVILTDIDGVVLNWFYAFDIWMNEHGHKLVDPTNLVYDVSEAYGIDKATGKMLVRMFNESAHVGFLPPLRDSMHYMKKLHEEHGYVFHAVTSLSNDEYAQHLRTKNLCELFGPTVFEKYVYLDTGADKDEALLPYKDTQCLWVEDKPENALVGKNLGLDAVLMAWEYNRDEYNVPRVQNWKAIYEYLVG